MKKITDTKYFVDKHGNVFNDKGLKRKFSVKKTGYCEITLSINGKVSYRLLHRVVWEAFYGSIPNGYHINHIDGNKTNNELSNLECISPKDNYEHSKMHMVRRGVDVNTAKLDEYKVVKIRKLALSGSSVKDLAKDFGITDSAIRRVVNKKTWSHIK